MEKECKPCQEAARRERLHTPVVREQAVVSRRGFMGMLLATSAAFAAASAPLAAIAADQAKRQEEAVEPVAIARADEVGPGGYVRFRFAPVAERALLVRLPGGELRAYSEECTHLGCAVYWDKGQEKIVCPCHKGYFDPVSGAPLAGPPRRPLPAIALEERDGMIYAVGREKG